MTLCMAYRFLAGTPGGVLLCKRGLSLVEDVPLLLALLFTAAWDKAPGEDAPDAAGVAAAVAVHPHLQRDQQLSGLCWRHSLH